MNNDFYHTGMPVTVPQNATILQKIRTLLGHYELRIFITDTAYIDIGRGSLDAIKFIGHTMPEFSGCIGTVGQFCNFAPTCELFGGGEHKNEMPINVVFPNVPVFGAMVEKYKVASLRPATQVQFKIGNGVVISSGVKVLAGAEIGDGSLIAAGGVVKGKIPSLSIAGGVPVKHIKYRVDEATRQAIERVRWWDFDLVYMGNSISQLQERSVDVNAQHIYRKPAPRFVLKVSNQTEPNIKVQILGFIEDEEFTPLPSAPQNVINYVNQLLKGPDEKDPSKGVTYHWIPDVWNM